MSMLRVTCSNITHPLARALFHVETFSTMYVQTALFALVVVDPDLGKAVSQRVSRQAKQARGL
jgi:hypothetical protein